MVANGWDRGSEDHINPWAEAPGLGSLSELSVPLW